MTGIQPSKLAAFDLSKPTEGRLILDPARPAALNMAIDEVMLENAVENRALSLRFYGWDQSSISIGYFQGLADRNCHTPSAHCPLVRRLSGGGAIVHGGTTHDLTYAIAVPNVPRRAAIQQMLYDTFHQTAILLLAECDVEATLCSESRMTDPQPFLCFQRRSIGDVLIGSHKVLGSAQRRDRRGLIQHGSILLSQTDAAPELPGIEQLAGLVLHPKVWISKWLDQLARVWPVRWREQPLADPEIDRARQKASVKFGHSSWNGRR